MENVNMLVLCKSTRVYGEEGCVGRDEICGSPYKHEGLELGIFSYIYPDLAL